jgi:hypothetical protein
MSYLAQNMHTASTSFTMSSRLHTNSSQKQCSGPKTHKLHVSFVHAVSPISNLWVTTPTFNVHLIHTCCCFTLGDTKRQLNKAKQPGHVIVLTSPLHDLQVLDEAHHTHSNNPYKAIMDAYNGQESDAASMPQVATQIIAVLS